MTVNEVIAELSIYVELGYGDKPLMWMNLNMQELEEVETVESTPDGSAVEVR